MDWTAVGTFSHGLVVSQAGVHVGNHGSPASATPEYTAVVDYFFNTSSPILDEDGGAGLLPVANDDAAATAEGVAVSIDVLANDSDADGSLVPASVTVTQVPADGTTSVNAASGEVTYTPDAGFSGTDSFRYTVEDNDGQASNEATVTVTVGAANAAPVANDDAAATAEGVAVAIDVLANDSDTDGSLVPASVTVTQFPASATVSVDTATGRSPTRRMRALAARTVSATPWKTTTGRPPMWLPSR